MPALGRKRQADLREMEASLVYIMSSRSALLYSETLKQNEKKKKEREREKERGERRKHALSHSL